jgi:ribosomal protein S12 methylthiotransferase
MSMPEADGFWGTANPDGMAEAAAQVMNGAENKLPAFNSSSQPGTAVRLPSGQRPLLSMPGGAYIKISEGCDNNCSFCAIPLIRGRLVSRDIPDILEECRMLLERGIRELCIIGQDIASFGTDSGLPRLAQLLESISALKGEFWVRLLYIHPDHFPYGILDIMERDKRFLPYFDIPFQHASGKLLTAMNRSGNAKTYLDLLNTIRARLPDAVIRSTFLLGFPGEIEEDFSSLLDFQQKARLDWLGCFAYSREEGTPASLMKGRVSKKTMTKRMQIVQERQIEITEQNMKRFAGRELDVLLEELIYGEDGDIWLGRCYCHAPEVDGAAVVTGNKLNCLQAGTIVRARVTACRGFDLEAVI